MAVVVALVVVAAVVVAVMVVVAMVVESRLLAAVDVVKDASKSTASLTCAAMSLIDVNDTLGISYGPDGNISHSRQWAEWDEW